MYHVAVLAMHGVIPFDLSIPCEVFGRVRVPGIDPAYHIRICGEEPEVRAGMFDLRVRWSLDDLAGAHTIIVPGYSNPEMHISNEVLDALRDAAANGTRIASICSGAFVLAAAGLLDGLRATTHWLAAPMLATLYPRVEVDPNVLFVDNGQILTSAGAAAGLDLCLHMVRCDYGAAVAADAARVSVMPLQREGGQAQFIVREAPDSDASLAPLLHWLDQHLASSLTLETLAHEAAMSTRTLNRRFREQTGTTPLQWILTARVRRAQQLLETTTMSIEQVACAVGFDSVTTFRERFRRLVGTQPHAYRRTFGQRPHLPIMAGAAS